MRLRSQYDGEILRLAVPALGSLAAEPLYVLVDTAIVGHLGRSQLAALGIAATVLSFVFAIFNFLQYATTAQVARDSNGTPVSVVTAQGELPSTIAPPNAPNTKSRCGNCTNEMSGTASQIGAETRS